MADHITLVSGLGQAPSTAAPGRGPESSGLFGTGRPTPLPPVSVPRCRPAGPRQGAAFITRLIMVGASEGPAPDRWRRGSGHGIAAGSRSPRGPDDPGQWTRKTCRSLPEVSPPSSVGFAGPPPGRSRAGTGTDRGDHEVGSGPNGDSVLGRGVVRDLRRIRKIVPGAVADRILRILRILRVRFSTLS
jgi:hypothetical protein